MQHKRVLSCLLMLVLVVACLVVLPTQAQAATVTVPSSNYPESAHDYANNLSETKTFSWPGATQLQVTFSSSTKVENNYDYIYLYNGSGSQIAKYTGVEAAGKTVTITGDSFSVKLTSDYSNTNYGYSFSSIVATVPDPVTETVPSSYYPESSHPYEHGLNETKTFSWPGATKLDITFSESTMVESNYDKIYLYDGEGNQVGVYTGAEAAGKTVTINSSSFSIKLTSDDSVSYHGYSFSTIVATMGGDNITTSGVTIIEQPRSVTVNAGEQASVSFTASGNGLSYAWYYKNAWETSFSRTYSFTGNSYDVTMDSSRNGRQLYCVVTDQNGNSVRTNTVTISMHPTVEILSQPSSVTVNAGEQANVSFTASGNDLSYAWYYKNAWETSFSRTYSFTGNSYVVTMDSSRNGRQLYCVVTDRYGNSVRTNTVTISMNQTVEILSQPSSVTVASGQTATVSLTARGEGLSYAWYYKNAGSSYFSRTYTFTGNSYVVTMDSSRNGRQVYCVVTDRYGNSVQSNTVTLTMATSVRITSQPSSTTVTRNYTATVSFSASGDGLSYKWYFKNLGETKFTPTSSFTGNTYSVAMTPERHGRQLYCVVTDRYGKSATTNTVTIRMTESSMNKATITSQPSSVTVSNGYTATVSFYASGDGLTYKWYYKNPGESKFTYTSSFTSNYYSVTMNAARDGRQLYCVVTDRYGNTAKTNTVTISMNRASKAWNLLYGYKNCKYFYYNPTDRTYAASSNGLSAYMYVYSDGTGYFYQNGTSSNMWITYNYYSNNRYYFTVRMGSYYRTLYIEDNPSSSYYGYAFLVMGDYTFMLK